MSDAPQGGPSDEDAHDGRSGPDADPAPRVQPSTGDRIATIVLWTLTTVLGAWLVFLSFLSTLFGIDTLQRGQGGVGMIVPAVAIGVLAIGILIVSIRWSLVRMRRGDAGWTAALLCLVAQIVLPALLSFAPLLGG